MVSLVVWLGAAAYACVLSAVSWLRFEAFIPESDLAVFAQLTWLLGRLEAPFSSVTMRPMLADHWEPALALLAPLGTIGVGTIGILLVQAAVLALTAPLLLALARSFGATGWTAAIVPLLWLVSPVVVRANLWDFHPDGLIGALLVTSVLAAVRGRTLLVAVAVVVACSYKEDAGLTFAAVGIALILNGYRRLGAALAIAVTAWTVLLNGVLLPWRWPATRAHYTERFVGDRGDSLGDLIRFWISNPVATVSDVVTPTNVGIVAILVAMTGGLCLLASRWLVIAVPSIALNLLSAYEGQHTLRYQYWLVPAAAVAIAGAAGAARVDVPHLRSVRVGSLVAGAALATLSLLAVGRVLGDVREEWPLRADRRAIVEAIPEGASVAAPLRFLSHLAERRELFTFPVPFVDEAPESEWSPAQIARARRRLDYVVFDRTLTRQPEVEAEILRLGFRPALRAGTTTLYARPRGS